MKDIKTQQDYFDFLDKQDKPEKEIKELIKNEIKTIKERKGLKANTVVYEACNYAGPENEGYYIEYNDKRGSVHLSKKIVDRYIKFTDVAQKKLNNGFNFDDYEAIWNYEKLEDTKDVDDEDFEDILKSLDESYYKISKEEYESKYNDCKIIKKADGYYIIESY